MTSQHLRSSTIQTITYTEPVVEADGQVRREPVHLRDISSDEYQMSDARDKHKLDTSTEGESLRGVDETTPIRRHGPQSVDTDGNNPPRLCPF